MAAVRVVALVLFGAALGAIPSQAKAYEDQITLGLDLAYARAFVGDLPTQGPMMGLSLGIGLGDAWTLTPRVAYAIHPDEAPLHVLVTGVELTYLFDILKVVPFVGVGLDGLTSFWQGEPGFDFAAHIVAGLDWLISRKWIAGIDIRAYVLPLALSSGIDPVYLTAGLRISYVFERY